jgi:hypothetical protein
MEPNRANYPTREEYDEAFRNWGERLRAMRMVEMEDIGVPYGNAVVAADIIFNEKPMLKDLKKELKKRHLNKQERDAFHNLKSDWCESPRGDVCKNASSLEIDDIVSKIK